MILNNKELSIWLIGPSAAGKTTVSKLLHEEIKDKMNLVIIDGDQVRNLYENNLGYDKISRSKNTRRYINLVKWLNDFKISSIVAVISPFEKDREICSIIGPILRKRGQLFVGIDIIGDYLTEINVTSPTGLQELDRFDGINAASLIWDSVETKL